MKLETKAAALNVYRLLLLLLAFSLCILPALPDKVEAIPVINTVSLPAGQVGFPYPSTLLSATCTGPCTWSYSGVIPPGLTFSGGIIQGTPTTVGNYLFMVTVTDSTGPSAPEPFTINITLPALIFSTTSIPGATVGQSYSATVYATGGTGTVTYALTSGGLPAGLILNAGQITGTPARGTAGPYNFTITATAGMATAQQPFSLSVDKGSYDVTVSISTGLAEGQTRLYVDNVPKGTLRGGESAKLTKLDPDSSVTVAVDATVANPGRPDIRYKAESSSARASEGISQIQFNYFIEYDVQVKSDPAGLTSVAGSGWYREGTPLNINAPQEIAAHIS